MQAHFATRVTVFSQSHVTAYFGLVNFSVAICLKISFACEWKQLQLKTQYRQVLCFFRGGLSKNPAKNKASNKKRYFEVF